MKNVAVFSCLLLAVTIVQADMTDTYLKLLKDPVTKCVKDLGLSGGSLREIYDKDEATNTDPSNCLSGCLLKSVGVLQNMKINEPKAVEIMKEAHADQPMGISAIQKIVAKCAEKANKIPEECKMVKTYVKCILEEE